ncbi:DUF2750 domain-containing protein [Fictibacillus barbaricus]|uniref:DUF2750 domain-containing protein n=1 Tax=Fictibacillus barbaricus TaxID=182136 RepID=A0ABS2ZHE5_9BACL|nr:DUF2750 domain-containing protein [Fictibacillus barbaricus]MBN3546861.1 DUF2750 domain-containing protein [Fictibacillus barbaricus]GGB44375.1 hypothetical protein GCM10007199_07240 [Fictibacillus barbaricus]
MKLIKRFILNRPAEKRLVYFYSMVATDEQVWLLRDENGDLLLLEDNEDCSFLLPVWPSRSFAEMEAANLEESYEAFNLPLSIFLDDLLVDIENDGGATAIFPNKNDTTVQYRDEIKEMISQI